MKTNDHYPPPGGTLDASHISASNATLLRQAPMTAFTYMDCAIVDIDAKLGAGYASKHPELIAAYMMTAALDMQAGTIARAIEGFGASVSGAINEFDENVSRSIDDSIVTAGKYTGGGLEMVAQAIEIATTRVIDVIEKTK
jgi:hypothetical protein